MTIQLGKLILMRKVILVLILSAKLVMADYRLSDILLEQLPTASTSISFFENNQHSVLEWTTDKIKINMLNKTVYSEKNKIKSPFGALQSNQIQYDFNKETMQFLKEVILENKDLKLNSEEAYVNLKTSVFIAKNNVIFKYLNKYAKADEATYSLNTNKVIFSENVLFKSNEDIAEGDQIIFDLNNETILSKGRAKIKVSKELLEK